MEKETLEKIKNGLMKVGAGIGLFTGIATFTACNNTSQSTTPNPNTNPNPGGDDKPPIEVTQYSVATILSEMEAFKNLDVEAAYDALAMSIADEKLFEATTLGYEIEGNTLTIIAKSKNGGTLTSVSVSVPSSATKYARISETMLKQTVLLSAGYMTTSTVENKAEAEQKLTAAINKIVSDIAAGKECTTVALNEYSVDGANINLSKVFPDGVVKGYVREDGTVLAYVYDKDTLTEHHYHFTQKGLYPNQLAEIIENGVKGVDYTEDVVVIDLTKKHTPPALEQEEVKEVDFDKLYAQVFGEDYTLPSYAELMDELLHKIVSTSQMQVLFTGMEDGKFALYAETTSSSGISSLVKSVYKGESDSVSEYASAYAEIQQYESLKAYLKEVCSGNGEVAEDDVLAILAENKSNYEKLIADIQNLTKKDFKSGGLLTNTTDLDNYKDFAEKLYGDKEIIYAGVSDLSGRLIDHGTFDTGYYESFKVVSVYKDGDKININIQEIYVPWYNNSTTESLYNSLLKDNKYAVINEETITITDSVEVQRLEEYLAKLEKFSQYEITGLDGLAENGEQKAKLYGDAYEALWLSLDK